MIIHLWYSTMRHLIAVMIIILLGVGAMSCGSLQLPTPLPWPTATRGPSHAVASNGLAFHEVWRQVVGQSHQTDSTNGPLMTIAADTLVLPVLGVRESRLVALGTQDGRRLWTRKLDNPGFPDIPVRVMSMLADPKRVYVTLLSFVAEAFDLRDGKPLWTTKKLREHAGYDIFPLIQNDTLQIYSSPKDTAIYNVNITNGQITSIEGYPGDLIMKTSTTKCFDTVASLSCVDDDISKSSWEIPTRGQVTKWPVLVNPETMIFAIGSSFKSIRAIDLTSGRALWQTPMDVICNMTVMNGIVYSIKADATLVAQDALTGHQTGLLQFSNSPFQRQPGAEYWVVAGDSMLFVYLGDSQELIAFGPN